MNWKIIPKNGIIGAILLIIPFTTMPYLGRGLNNFFNISWILPITLVIMVVLCFYVIIEAIPTMKGFSRNNWKVFEIILTEIIAISIFIASVCFLYNVGFYNKL